jgi:hypothetical protein
MDIGRRFQYDPQSGREKRGNTSSGTRIWDFQNLIDNSNLIDTETSNGIFTWTNRRTRSHQIACRLDRFLLSDSLMLEGTALETCILDVHGSDHWPIQLWLDIPATPGQKPFRLEQFWLSHPDFQQKVHTWWREAAVPYGSKMYRFQQKLKNFKQKLKTWNKHTFGNIFEAQKKLMDQMGIVQSQIREQGISEDLKAQEAAISQKLEERKSQEEILWRQKSRIQWLKEGDRNTKFFHRSTIQRRHTNHITQLISDNGKIIHSHEDLEEELVAYYQNLLTEPQKDRSQAITRVTQHIPTLIMEEKNVTLLRPITLEEVDQALQDTPKGKAPGPMASPLTSSTIAGK